MTYIHFLWAISIHTQEERLWTQRYETITKGFKKCFDLVTHCLHLFCKKCMRNSWWSLHLSFLFVKNILNKGKLGPELEPGQRKVVMANVKNSQTFQIIILSLYFVNSYKNLYIVVLCLVFTLQFIVMPGKQYFLLHCFWPVYKLRLICLDLFLRLKRSTYTPGPSCLRVDSAIHRINLSPVDNVIRSVYNTLSVLDNDLSGG